MALLILFSVFLAAAHGLSKYPALKNLLLNIIIHRTLSYSNLDSSTEPKVRRAATNYALKRANVLIGYSDRVFLEDTSPEEMLKKIRREVKKEVAQFAWMYREFELVRFTRAIEMDEFARSIFDLAFDQTYSWPAGTATTDFNTGNAETHVFICKLRARGIGNS